jgi:hypothetical protein
MPDTEYLMDLGFAKARVPPGSHVCQIYGKDEERDHALSRFLSRGLLDGDAVACFSEHLDELDLPGQLQAIGLEYGTEVAQEHLTARSAEGTYFAGGYFDPDRILSLVEGFYARSRTNRRKGARVIGEMSSRISHIEGGSRLFEYEGKVNSLLRSCPVTAVCQYDARAFDGATIMDVLAVHPLMVVQDHVIQNPFFVPPEDYAKR